MSLPTPQMLLEHAWQAALSQCMSGSGDVVLPITVVNSLGQLGIPTIMQRFSAFTGHQATLIWDEASGVIRISRGAVVAPTNVETDVPNPQALTVSQFAEITPLPASVTKGKAVPRKALAKRQLRNRVPRPPNAFILYRQHHHPRLKAENPDMHNNNISVVLGKQWKSESEQTRAHFKSLADDLKHKHHLEHPEYHYQPRRPSEKKRRVSHQKAKSLAVSSMVAPVFRQPVSFGTPTGGIMQFESASQSFAIATSSGSQTFGRSFEAVNKAIINGAPITAAWSPNITDSGPVVVEALGNVFEAPGNVFEAPGNVEGGITDAGPDSIGLPDIAQAGVTNSGSVGENDRGNPHNDGIAGSTSNDAQDIGNASITEHGELKISFPYAGSDGALARLVDDWNKMHPAGCYAGSAYPLPITQVSQPFSSLDPDFYLVNWGEIEAKAELDALETEQDFLSVFPSQMGLSLDG